MALKKRVTLRCLVEDLTAGWESGDQYRAVQSLRDIVSRHIAGDAKDSDVARHIRCLPPLNSLAHPLVRQFSASFQDVSPSRESISGLTNPHWWKQKAMQWRGAATDHSLVGTDSVWLCAAGIRRQGNSDDFYKSFLRDVQRVGPEPWLPSLEDREAERIDNKVLEFDAWKLQIHSGVLVLLTEALASPGCTSSMSFPKPALGVGQKKIGTIELSADRVSIDGEELTEVFLVGTILDRAQVKSVDLAVQIARAALQKVPEEWKSTTYGEDRFAFSAMIDPQALAQAAELYRSGNLPEDSLPGDLRLGLRAHFARKHGLVDAQVEGSAVLSLCGYWFVPTADHAELSTCSECSQRHSQMSAV